jgi:hypothetical protein
LLAAQTTMKFLLDAKDLIDVVEHNIPVRLMDFGARLRRRGDDLVLTTTNVREFVAPLMRDGDFLKMRHLVQQLEALPVRYLREGTIIETELTAAWQAYESGRDYVSVDPYVKRWDATIFPREATTRVIVGYRLDQMIYALWRGPARALLIPQRNIKLIRQSILEERRIRATNKFSAKRTFISSVERHFMIGKRFGVIRLPLDRIDFQALGKWIYEDPARCPGFRLHYHTFHELAANVGDPLQDSDLLDFAHVPATPYVDAITMDRRMADYVKRVGRRLAKNYDSENYANRIFTKLGLLLKTDP